MNLKLFVGKSHADYVFTQQSYSVYNTFIGCALIIWSSKIKMKWSQWCSVRYFSLGGNFKANRSVRYNIRMLVVEVDGPTNMFSDNQIIFFHALVSESMCNNKNTSVDYHSVRWVSTAWEQYIRF